MPSVQALCVLRHLLSSSMCFEPDHSTSTKPVQSATVQSAIDRVWVGVSCSHGLDRQFTPICCWSLGFPAVMQGTDAALGNLSGTERPISLLQRYCQEALPAEKGQHHSHMLTMDTRCQKRWRLCMCYQDGGIPWKLSETSCRDYYHYYCKDAPCCLCAESESAEWCVL